MSISENGIIRRDEMVFERAFNFIGGEVPEEHNGRINRKH